MNFAVFSDAGEPVRAGVCPEGQVNAQAREGEVAVPWVRDMGKPQDWRLVDGELERR